MAGATGATGAASGDLLAVSVYGEHGIVDLLVPLSLTGRAVLTEYSRLAGGAPASALLTRGGVALDVDAPLRTTVAPGAVLVALPAGAPHPPPRATPPDRSETPAGRRSMLIGAGVGGAIALAATAGWLAGPITGATPPERSFAGYLLLVGAALALLPVGRAARIRPLAAPVFAVAGVWAAAGPAHDAAVVGGFALLAAAAVAGVARALGEATRDAAGRRGPGEGVADAALEVVLVAGAGLGGLLFAAHGLGLDAAAVCPWVLIAALFGARVAPAWVVPAEPVSLTEAEDVGVIGEPLTRGEGRPPASVVVRADVEDDVHRARHRLAALGVVLAVVIAVSALALAATDQPTPDRWGTAALLPLVGLGLALAASDHRDVPTRTALRCAAAACALAAVWAFGQGWGPQTRSWVMAAALSLGAVAVAVAVAAGQGWRSVWWARRADIAEAAAGALAVGAACLSSGLFRLVWELASRG